MLLPLLELTFPPRLPFPLSLWLERLRVLFPWFDPEEPDCEVLLLLLLDLPEELLVLVDRAPLFAAVREFVPSSSCEDDVEEVDLFLDPAEPVVDRDFDVPFVGLLAVDFVVAIFNLVIV